jgi:hypothetical protein
VAQPAGIPELAVAPTRVAAVLVQPLFETNVIAVVHSSPDTATVVTHILKVPVVPA